MSHLGTIPVPAQTEVGYEGALLQLWLVTNQVASRLSAGDDPQPLVAVLHEELTRALGTLHQCNRHKLGGTSRHVNLSTAL